MSMGDPSQTEDFAKQNAPACPILTGCLVQIGMGWSEVFVQCEHLDACGKNSYLFHCTVNRLPSRWKSCSLTTN